LDPTKALLVDLAFAEMAESIAQGRRPQQRTDVLGAKRRVGSGHPASCFENA
jgi:hypothetical protein